MARHRRNRKSSLNLQNINKLHLLWLLVPVIIFGVSKWLNDRKKKEKEQAGYANDAELYAALIAQALGTYAPLAESFWNIDLLTEDEAEALRIVKENASIYNDIALEYSKKYKRKLSDDLVEYLDSDDVAQIQHII